ncbi:MAG: hypothetical protein FWD39_00780 [Clostridiales bacterium]|nr:hypothetical protein [Clostridiales bacterium]
MPDYEKMYFALAAKVTDIIELLIKVQQECEEEYISAAYPCETKQAGVLLRVQPHKKKKFFPPHFE